MNSAVTMMQGSSNKRQKLSVDDAVSNLGPHSKAQEAGTSLSGRLRSVRLKRSSQVSRGQLAGTLTMSTQRKPSSESTISVILSLETQSPGPLEVELCNYTMSLAY
eukprot:scaffold330898_cov47-Prasinocladus_malaysianus.AAC.1